MSLPLLKKLGILLLSLLALWLGSRYLLPIALPFLLAALLALISEPLVRVLKSRLRLPDWAASGAGVTVTLLTATLTLAALLAFLLQQAGRLANVLPDLEETALQGMYSLELFLLDMASRIAIQIALEVGRFAPTSIVEQCNSTRIKWLISALPLLRRISAK